MTDYILSLSEYDVCSYIYTTGNAFLVSICPFFLGLSSGLDNPDQWVMSG